MMSLPLPADMPSRRQLASVRGIVLDDGPERGTRALVFSTGGGLDFWLLTDRTMDIGPLWHRGVPLAWQHPAGFLAPGLHASHADGGTGIERTLSGLLVTCGLDNPRQPARGLPLHGSLPASRPVSSKQAMTMPSTPGVSRRTASRPGTEIASS